MAGGLSLLFLDEPTSGLDSTASKLVVQVRLNPAMITGASTELQCRNQQELHLSAVDLCSLHVTVAPYWFVEDGPKLLILNEPTSGLDSTASKLVVQVRLVRL
jgi:ABC-type molybdenum transport system ATPase subunit/photorepair protein PhrA